MACKIEINDKTYSDILGQVKDPVIAMRLYLQDSSDNMIAKTVLPAEKKVLNLIDSRLKKIDEKVQSKEGNKFVLKDEKNRLETIKKQLKEELKEGNTLYFYTTAKDYLAEIEKAVEGDISDDRLKSYYTATKMMEDFSSNFSDLEMPSDKEISLRAKELSLKLEKLVLQSVLNKARKRGFVLEEDDLKYLKETSKAAALTLDLSMDSNEFSAYVNKVVKEATILRDFQLQKELKELKELEKGLSKEDKQKIFKKDAKGRTLRNQLVTRQSELFLKEYNSLKDEIDELRKNEDWLNFKTKRRQLLNWKATNTVFVNPSYFTTTDESEKRIIFEKLAISVGSEEYAEELIQQSTNKWNAYQKELESYNDYIDGQSDKTDVQKEELKREFVVQNSPAVYFEILFLDRDIAIKKYNIKPGDHFSEKFTVFAPIASKEQYISQEFKDLQKNTKLFNYYLHLKETMTKYKSFLPEYSKENARKSDYIYRSKAGIVEIFQNSGMAGAAPKATSAIIDAFTTQFEHTFVSEIDSNGNAINSVPVGELLNIDAEISKLENVLATKILTPEEKTNIANRLNELNTSYTIDPSASVEVFLALALNYKFLSDIAPEVELASEVFNAARSKEENGVIGNPVNLKSQFNYYIDAIMYGKGKAVEGQTKKGTDFQDDIFGISDLIGVSSVAKKQAKKLSKQINENKPRVTELIEKQDSGVELTIEEQSEISAQKALVAEYRHLGGRRFTWGSFLDRVIGFQAAKTFAYNPFSAVTNGLFGMLSISTEANAGTYFNHNDTVKAFGIMLDSSKKYLSLDNVQTGYSDKITTLVDKFSLAEDVNDVKYNRNIYKKKLEDKLNPYGFMASSDFFMKGVGSFAAMRNTNKWSLTALDGSIVSIWDAFDKNGNFRSDMFDSETNFQWDGDVMNGGSLKLAEYTAYLKQINANLHGLYDRNSPVLAKKHVLGRLIGQYKLSWIPRSLSERFSGERYDHTLDEIKEGRYKTIARLATEQEDLGATIITRAIKLLLNANREGLKPHERANILKTRADILFYATMTIIIMLLKRLASDDDDKEGNPVAKLLINQMQNLKQDIGFAVSPSIFESMTSKVIPAVSVLTDFSKAISKTTAYIITDYETDKKQEKAFDAMWKQIFKSFPFVKNIETYKFRSTKLLENINN